MKAEQQGLRGLIDQLEGMIVPESPGAPPLNPPPPDGTSADMAPDPKADWEPRVSRLEMGFCAAFLLIFAAIITSYLMVDAKIAAVSEKVVSLQVEQAHVSDKLDLLLERTAPKK